MSANLKMAAAARQLLRAGSLSEGAVSKLRAAKMLPSVGRYATGLWKGNWNLARKFKVNDVSAGLSNTVPTFGGTVSGRPTLSGPETVPQLVERFNFGSRLLGPGPGSPPDISRVVDQSPLGKVDHNFFREMVRRHELNEMREGQRLYGGRNLNTEELQQIVARSSRGFKHHTPGVLVEEGRDLAGASPRIKNLFRQVRSWDQSMYNKPTELQSLQNLYPQGGLGAYNKMEKLAFSNLLRRGIGRVVTNIHPPYGYELENTLRNVVKKPWQTVKNIWSDAGPYGRGYPNNSTVLRDTLTRANFGLPMRKSYAKNPYFSNFLKNPAPGVVELNPENDEGRSVLNSIKTMMSERTGLEKDFNGQRVYPHTALGSLVPQKVEGAEGVYQIKKPWWYRSAYDPNNLSLYGNRADSALSRFAARAVDKISKPVTFQTPPFSIKQGTMNSEQQLIVARLLANPPLVKCAFNDFAGKVQDWNTAHPFVGGMIDFLPGVGTANMGIKSYDDFRNGRYWSGAANALGAGLSVLPGVGGGLAKLVGGGAKLLGMGAKGIGLAKAAPTLSRVGSKLPGMMEAGEHALQTGTNKLLGKLPGASRIATSAPVQWGMKHPGVVTNVAGTGTLGGFGIGIKPALDHMQSATDAGKEMASGAGVGQPAWNMPSALSRLGMAGYGGQDPRYAMPGGGGTAGWPGSQLAYN